MATNNCLQTALEGHLRSNMISNALPAIQKVDSNWGMESVELLEKIIELSDAYEEEIIALRQALHQNPELSFQEYKTAQRIMEKLGELRIDVQGGIAGTGIMATVRGDQPGRTLLLRADMDALPVEETVELPFKSANPGIMHACGHDVHMAALYGVAKILNELSGKWSGEVKLIFQPGEENGGGGREMIKEGILEKPRPDCCMALHVCTQTPTGALAMGSENVSAYSDMFTIKVHGKGAHSSLPQNGVDALNIAAHIIVALNSVMTKNMPPMEISTFTIGKLNGGTAPNIIANEAELVGMMRNITAEARSILIDKIESIAKGIASTFGGKADFILREGYPAVYNDPQITGQVRQVFLKYYKTMIADISPELAQADLKEQVIESKRPILGAEDFGFYTQQIPSCFFRVGTGNTGIEHSSSFSVDEKYIKLCVRSMAFAAVDFLTQRASQ